MKNTFRILILVALFAMIAPLIIPHQMPTFMPHIRDEISKLSVLALDEFETLVSTLIYVGIFSLILLLVSLVGLFFFWPPSRELFIVSIILILITVGFKGYDRQMGVSIVLGVLLYADAIAIIVISYMGPINKYFARTKS